MTTMDLNAGKLNDNSQETSQMLSVQHCLIVFRPVRSSGADLYPASPRLPIMTSIIPPGLEFVDGRELPDNLQLAVAGLWRAID
jgi:hypothetical protein